ncbi:MAG: hypothetical protein IPP34_15775 [Bacteroidetes bacterium]|nr:hypothetical protein [Bacteroidota bacterium]
MRGKSSWSEILEGMHKVVHSICQAFKPALERKKVKLDVTIGSEVPEILIEMN